MKFPLTERHIKEGERDSTYRSPFNLSINESTGWKTAISKERIYRWNEYHHVHLWENGDSFAEALLDWNECRRLKPGTLIVHHGKLHYQPEEQDEVQNNG